jgi:non-specific serine/threonine protein kinase
MELNEHDTRPVEALTRRELDILRHVAAGKSNAEITKLETLSADTVKWYVKQLYAKLGVKERAEIGERARELGLIHAVTDEVDSRRRSNLPQQLTSFIGRQKEIAELRALLRRKDARLVTLTGTGGTGKTRLALQAATPLVDSYPDGIWLVELGVLADPGLVAPNLLSVLGQTALPGKPPLQQVCDYLREKQLLLILDNCEHLVEACANAAQAVLQAAPGLKVLATSREILGVSGEVAYRVPPLALPSEGDTTADKLSNYDAVRLFVERAQLVNPNFLIVDENAAAVVQIVRRLDGIPLAIELAAARLRVLDVRQIAERIHDAFRLLTGGSRTALPRHQTLTALIDWSFNLLCEEEKRGLRYLSVFAGSWTLEAAETVCLEVCAPDSDVLALLEALVDKSLIIPEPAAEGEIHYRMLETVRQYAHTRLMETNEAETARNRHLAYYLALGERLEPMLRGRTQITTLDRLGRELENLRLALEWALRVDVMAELRLASALFWFWHIRYHWEEEIGWLERGLEAETNGRDGHLPQENRALIRAKALAVLGFEIYCRDNQATRAGLPFIEEAVTIYAKDPQGDPRGLAWALTAQARCLMEEHRHAEARRSAETARDLYRRLGDAHGIVENLITLVEAEGQLVTQRHLLQEALALDRDLDDQDGMATTLCVMGHVEYADAEFERSSQAHAAARECYRRVGNTISVARTWFLQAVPALMGGDWDQAEKCLREALTFYRENANEPWIANCLAWQCRCALVKGDLDGATELNAVYRCLAQKSENPFLTAEVNFLQLRLDRQTHAFDEIQRLAVECACQSDPFIFLKAQVEAERAYLAFDEHDLDTARRLLQDCVRDLVEREAIDLTGWLVDCLALLAAQTGQIERAAVLFSTRQAFGCRNVLTPPERAAREQLIAGIKTALGAESYQQLRKEGQNMDAGRMPALLLRV